MTRRDDIAARQLDEIIDEMQLGCAGESHADGARRLHAVPDELADAADMLNEDAMATGHVPRDIASLRRRVLDGAAEHDRSRRRARLPRKARTYGRPRLARRALVPTMMFVILLTATTAVAHTDTQAGEMVRTAARTLNLPAPAGPKPRPAPAPEHRDEVPGDHERAEAPDRGHDAPSGGDDGSHGEIGPGQNADPEAGPRPHEPQLGVDGEPLHPDGPKPSVPPVEGAPRPPEGDGPKPQPQPSPDSGAPKPGPNGDRPVAPPPGERPPGPNGDQKPPLPPPPGEPQPQP